jgi:hypothetical protein
MHMRPKQLQTYLENRGDPPIVRKQIYDTVVAQQERIANNGRRHSQVVKHWAPLFVPLRNEIKAVRSMQAYNPRDVQRQEVLAAYMQALIHARGLIDGAKIHGMTPHKYQEWRVERGKKPFPNDLTHWVDLVPSQVQAAITDAFEDLPYKARAKRKVPFTRD